MGVGYKPVLWNRQKRRYDVIMLLMIAVYLAVFSLVTISTNPYVRPETLVIRGTASLAFVMLHVILAIGPLARLNEKFLPLLYNRRHLGVTMCLIALIHGVFAIIQFHSLGNIDPIASIFSSNIHYDAPSRFPFQPLGFIALIILLFMAVTSHDFWLKNLSPRVWKALHMGVYFAYVLLIGHVALGILQYESSPVRYLVVAVGMVTVITLHLAAAKKSRRDQVAPSHGHEDLVRICSASEIADNRARMIVVRGQEIAIFKYGDKVSAVHNLCKHQNGPLGEGKVVDGCITCPWHGYQYKPEDGCSPPPFTEKISTYKVEVLNGDIFVDPRPLPEGTFVDPARLRP